MDFAEAEQHVLNDETTEHISLGDEYEERRSQSRTITTVLEVNDRLRGRKTGLTLYEEGFLKLVEQRRGKIVRRHRLDLRYLDPAPTTSRHYPVQLLKVALGCSGVALISGALAAFGVWSRATVPLAVVASFAIVTTLLCFVYLSHEKICFYTLHGRAKALQLGAGLGYIRRFKKLIPDLVQSIESAADSIGEDTIVYLRSEMREHYRLRGDGILSHTECSDSTERILGHFDEPL
jgi:hypothetical protein